LALTQPADSATEGQFIYEQLAPGSYLLTAGKIPWEYGERVYAPERGSIRVVMSEGEDQEIKVRLKAIELTEKEIEERWPYTVTGYVRDRLGNGMQGVAVTAHVGMGTLPQGGRVLGGPDGGYTLRFPAFGRGGFVVVVGPHHPEYFERDFSRQGDLFPLWTDEPPRQTWGHPASRWIVAHRPHAVDFVMLPAVRVEGRLLDERGNPISECWVSVSGPVLPPASIVLGSMQTDAAGSFHFDSLPPVYVCRFELPDEVAVETSFDEPGPHSVVLQKQRSPDGLNDVLLLRQSAGH
jgi:hypothetical protein